RHEEAEASFRQAHALYTEDDNPGAAALCLEWIADTYAARDRHADAEEHRRAAVEAYEGLDRPVDAARMLDLVADSIRFQGRHEDALDAYRKVVDWEEEVAAGTIARAYHGRALALGRLGRLSDSSLDYRRAWWAYRALGDSTAAARSMLGIARNHRNEQSPHRAVHACRAVIRLLRSRPDPDGLCGDAHQLLGQIFASSGETVWAVEEYGKAIFEHTRARCLGDVIRDQMLLAIVSLDDGLNKAKILHLGAQAKAVAASDRKSMLTAAGIFAHALASNGDPAGAQRVLESAGVGRDEADEEDIPELRLAKGALAVVRDFSADGSGRSSGSGRPGSPLARASLALMGQDWEAVISIHREVNSDPTARCSQGTAAFGAFLRICAAAYIARDRWLEAESCLDECLNVVHRLPEGPARWNLNSGAEALLGQVRLETGRAEEAYEHFRAAHASAQKSPVPAVRVQGQVMLGQAIAHPGASEKMLRLAARVLYGAATEAFDSGLSAQAIGGDCLRAIVHAKLGDNEFALKILDYDIGYARRHGMPQSLSSLLTTKAVLLEASGAAEASADVLREAAEAAEAEGLFEALGDSLRDLARVTAGLGRDLGEVQSIADSAADAYWRAGLPQEIARLRLDIVDELWEKSDDRGRARTRSEFLATALPAMRYLDSIRYDFLSASERASWQRQYLWGRSLTFEMAASGGGSDTVSDLIETQINASVFGSAGQQGAKTLGAPPAVHDPHGQGPIEAKPTAGLMAGFQLAATASGTGVHLVSSALPVSPPPNLLIPSAGGCRVALARFPAGEDLTIPADEASVRTW
ncbi:tetratricopeptide repeat protein, partial [Sinomonas cellulolyticus]